MHNKDHGRITCLNRDGSISEERGDPNRETKYRKLLCPTAGSATENEKKFSATHHEEVGNGGMSINQDNIFSERNPRPIEIIIVVHLSRDAKVNQEGHEKSLKPATQIFVGKQIHAILSKEVLPPQISVIHLIATSYPTM